jgi:septal ring factor EnvC (AmiA/AmiB activator)
MDAVNRDIKDSLRTETRELKRQVDAVERSMGAIDRKLEKMDDSIRDIDYSIRTIERATERLVRDNDDRWRMKGSWQDQLMILMSFVWVIISAMSNAARRIGPM